MLSTNCSTISIHGMAAIVVGGDRAAVFVFPIGEGARHFDADVVIAHEAVDVVGLSEGFVERVNTSLWVWKSPEIAARFCSRRM